MRKFLLFTCPVKSRSAGRAFYARLFRGVIHYSLIIMFLFGGTANAGFLDWLGSFFRASGTDLHSTADGLVGHWMLDSANEWYGAELLTYPGFEGTYNTTGTLSIAPGWENWEMDDGVDTAAEETTIVHSGLKSQKIITDAATEGVRVANMGAVLTVGKRYKASIWVYPTSAGQGFFFQIYDGVTVQGNNTRTDFTTNQWNYISFTFTADGTGSAWFRFLEKDIPGTIYIDDASVKEIKMADSTSSENHGSLYRTAVNYSPDFAGGAGAGTFYATNRYTTTDGAMDFNGTTDKVDVGSDVVGTGADSVAAWIYLDTWGEGTTYSYLVSNGKFIFGPEQNSGSLGHVFFLSDGATEIDSANNGVSLGAWHHVAATRTSDGTTNFYVNGVLSGTANQASGTPAGGTTNVIFGSNNAGSATVDGKIADVRLYNRVLTSWEIKKIYEDTVPDPDSRLTDGLVGRWTLSQKEETGGQAGDTTGSGRHGTLTGTAYITDHNGISNGATTFNGINEKISIAASDTLRPLDHDFSVSVWFKTSANGYIISDREIPGGIRPGFQVSVSAGKFRGFLELGTGSNYRIKTSLKTVVDNVWHHGVMTWTFSSNTITLYVDGAVDTGTLLDGGTVTNVQSTLPIVIGNSNDNESDFTGSIEDVRVYNRTLSAREISQLYSGYSTTRNRTLNDGLQARWTLANRDGVVTGSELVTNGTMEADSNWSNYNTPTLNAQSIEQVSSGTYSRKLTTDSTDGIQSSTFTTVAGKRYKGTFRVYPSDGTRFGYAVRTGDGTGWIVDSSQSGLTQDSWNEVSFYYTETTSGASAYIILYDSIPDTGTFYIDQVSIKEVQATDVSGNARHGTITEAVAAADHDSVAASALDFNGTTSKIDAGTDFIGTSAATVSAWIYADSMGEGNNRGTIIDNGKIRFFIENNGGDPVKFRILFYSDGSTYAGSLTNILQSSILAGWHHFVATRTAANPSITNIYIDAVNVASDNSSGTPTVGTTNVIIGNNSGQTLTFDGKISDVRVWNRVLSPWEVWKLYNES